MTNIPTVDLKDQAHTEQLFVALGEQLHAQGASIELVVIGGSALLAIGLISRPTRDVDIVGFLQSGQLADPRPLPEALIAARDRVARDFDLLATWLNPGPASLLDFGVPEGFLERLESRRYGPALLVHFASRFDQIHFKLYAMADGTAGKHEADLRELNPTHAELIAAARWTQTHDPSEPFREELLKSLAALGVDDAARDL